MNEGQYRELCDVCDRILVAPDSTIERVAIPWLHVIREHPVFLRTYSDLFQAPEGVEAVSSLCRRIVRNRALWFRDLGRALWVDGHPWSGSSELRGRVDVLFVSHLLSASQVGHLDDFYFGKVPHELSANGHSVVVALINHSCEAETSLAGKWCGLAVPRVVLSRVLGVRQEVAIRRRLREQSTRLRRLAESEAAGLSRKVLVRASAEALSSGSRTALRIGAQVGALVATLQPRAIVITHEGHAWERVAFAAAREAAPGVRCIGYQPATLFRLQHAVRRGLAPQYNPDRILTAGAVGKAQLESVSGLRGIPVAVLGSNRGFSASTAHHASGPDRDSHGPSQRLACLVLPEGIVSECHVLFDFTLKCAELCPKITFILRLHPLITFESLAVENPQLRDLPGNVVVSQATLQDDIALSRWALYRGTTAIVQAVGGGLRPIYLQVPGEMTIDPLYELDAWRVTISTHLEFERVVETHNDVNQATAQIAQRRAREYCEKVFLPFDHNTLLEAVFEGHAYPTIDHHSRE